MEHFMIGLEALASVDAFIVILIGVVWGTVGGVIPGINGTIAMALLLPFTYGMVPAIACMMLVAAYCGAEYGGSIPAILIGTPGTNAAAATVLDGYEMHKKGKTGLALYLSLYASCFGGLFGTVCLILVAIPLASVALAFGPAEYFLLAMTGLTLICSLGEDNIFKGIWAGLLGILLSFIGLDPFAGAPRMTFGSLHLSSGLEMVPLMMGMFAISEVLRQAQTYKPGEGPLITEKSDTRMPPLRELTHWKTNIVSSVIGVIVGVMPGAGATVASFLAYSWFKRTRKDGDTFGKGNPIGVVAPEAANNSVTGGALVPLLALGIPGSNSTAIMLGALIIHNITPGPTLFTNHPEIPYGIFSAMFVANIIMFFVGIVCIKAAIKVTSISKPALFAGIIALVYTGSYAFNGVLFDVFVAFVCGILGLAMRRFGLPHAATVLGFVLGVIMETNLRRALILTKGSYAAVFGNSTITILLTLIAITSLLLPLMGSMKKKFEAKKTY
ncbi:MAG: tripartite tricarboxylate transporter permease [Planctomycetota bacterium]|jgi:putative tricarboxylic transport membrane protein|nr:tripartite tricarboxylate transporter permease [Planctomycetota bacterium]